MENSINKTIRIYWQNCSNHWYIKILKHFPSYRPIAASVACGNEIYKSINLTVDRVYPRTLVNLR